MKNKKGILIAFGEMFLKSKGVKNLFQKRLVENLSFFLKQEKRDFKIYSFRERIFIETDEIKKSFTIIKRIFGIAWFAEVFYTPKTSLKEFSKFIDNNYQDWIKKDETFAIRLKMEKGIINSASNLAKKNRDKVIKKIAENINRKVNLSKPNKEFFVEIRTNGWFLYFKKKKAQGGLPTGSSGKVLTLMSGGIDSPVAAFLMNKKGVENIWLHFHSFPLVSDNSIEKVKELAEIFLNYQTNLKIYFVPFHKAQMKIKAKTPAKYRVLLYRRLMFRIAEIIAEKENCQALATGESLGQVSSQTLPNIKIVEQAIKIPVLRPLIAKDKEEIIKLAQGIRTFQISIKPQEDCCTLFVSKHQTAQGNMETIKKLEKKLKIREMIKEIKTNIKVEKYYNHID